MPIIFVDGFDHLYSATSADYVTKGWVVGFGAAADFETSTETPQGSGRSLRCRGTVSNNQLYRTISLTTAGTCVVNFWLRLEGAGLAARFVVGWYNGSTIQASLGVAFNISSWRLRFYRQTATTLGTGVTDLALNTWYHIEVKFRCANSISANDCIVYLNGVEEINLAAATDTQADTVATVNRVYLFGPNSGTGNHNVYDNFFIEDGTALYGKCQVVTLSPNGAGNSAQFTPLSGSNWENVDEVSFDGDTTYNSTSTVAHTDVLTKADLTANPAQIHAVAVNVVHRASDAGTRQIAPVVRSGGTDYVGTTVTCTMTYAGLQRVYSTDPATSAAWTDAAIDALQVGYRAITHS